MTIGSLFSGIGGLELGLERAGLGPVLWQAESDRWCRRVLAKHWPEARRYEDVRDVGPEAAPVELVCGGFPCQDVSDAGRRRGLQGERSGLWSEFARVLRVVRPRFAVVENVAALLARGRGMERVLGDLAELGFDAEWHVIPAAAVRAPHLRARVLLLAYPRGFGGQEDSPHPLLPRGAAPDRCSWWKAEPEVARVADGLSQKVDSRALRALGNAVVPQVAEVIGRAIVEASS